MTDAALADLRLGLRDLPGVIFVATSETDGGVRVQVTVDDPSVVAAVERAVADRQRRNSGPTPTLEVHVAGVRRSPLALTTELRAIDGVESIDLVRGARGELLRATIATRSSEASRQVRELLDERVGRGFRQRRVRITEVADSGA